MQALLDRVSLPEDVGGLDLPDLERLASELRELILSAVSRTGGHLAANLGVVELTVALLKIFAPPRDALIWDTTHQCYTYKALTGRKDRLCTLRRLDGLSGFLKRSESRFDAFGAGHAGTAISAALGFAAARDRRGGSEHVVAIVGDASICNGISFEALNNIGTAAKRLIVVLNDNEMSIGANVGALSRYMGKLLTSPRYNRMKAYFEGIAKRLRMGAFRGSYHRMEESIKGFFVRNVLFEEFGLRYIGPIDGHNIGQLVDALTVARDYDRPILVHVATQKGRGFPPAERHPEKWHGTGCFDVATGERETVEGPTYSEAFGACLERMAERDERIVAITAAMCSNTGLAPFAARFPDRFFDVGICEEHGAVFAAGLAAAGLRPVYPLYSTFAQRVVDNVMHDVCLQNLPVVFGLDRAGVVGDDGPTHHGVFDIPMLRCLPGLTFMQPKDEAELAGMLHLALALDGPSAIRYPRGGSLGVPVPDAPPAIEAGRAEALHDGADCAIWALGDTVPLALAAREALLAQGISAAVVNARFIKPFDTALLSEHARRFPVIATVENGAVSGGFGSALAEWCADSGAAARVLRFGWPDSYVEHGSARELFERYGLTAPAIAARISDALAAARNPRSPGVERTT